MYTTNDEILYIDNIGKMIPSDWDVKPTENEMLLNYLNAMPFRTVWGDIDVNVIVEYVLKRLALVQALDAADGHLA